MRAALIALALAPAVALACWNEVRLTTSEEAKAVARAEAALQAGDAVKVIKVIRATYGKRAVLHPDRITSSPPLGRKARSLISIAMVRDGRIDPRTGRPAKKSRHAEIMRITTDWLARHARRAKGDPLAQAWHAEAMSLEPHRRETARGILEGLAKDDLLAEPEGWRTLARLRTAAGDAPGAKQALDRCVAMASAARCALPAAGGS